MLWMGANKTTYAFYRLIYCLALIVIVTWCFWRQNRTSELDQIHGSAMGSNGCIIMCGSSEGNWSATSLGSRDFTAIKINVTGGQEVWRWQASDELSFLRSVLLDDYNLR